MPKLLSELSFGWRDTTSRSENTLQQLAPYIGKLKPSLAQALVTNYSERGDVVGDPFCGSGVVCLEALTAGRNIVANDINPYAAVLTQAKLNPLSTLDEACQSARAYISQAKLSARDREWQVEAPTWVASFFHQRTLAEVKCLADILILNQQWFLLANLLGILHHQRPGFLSFPASHLVPYLRDKKFPRSEFPELYEYRDVEPRLLRKLHRTYRNCVLPPSYLGRTFTNVNVTQYRAPGLLDVVITSPPYMNALDYGRDNRLRLWFVSDVAPQTLDGTSPGTAETFQNLMEHTAALLYDLVRTGGKAVFVVGNLVVGKRTIQTHSIIQDAFERHGRWRVYDHYAEPVPDIRRSRRTCCATKTEWILVFSKQ